MNDVRVDFASWLWPQDFLPGAIASAPIHPDATPAPALRLKLAREKIYRGVRKISGCVVTVEEPGAPAHGLSPRYDLANHSPDGYAWGYHGSGPAQLSLALLADALDDDERALALYQAFKRVCIANLDQNAAWELSAAHVRALAAGIEQSQAAFIGFGDRS